MQRFIISNRFSQSTRRSNIHHIQSQYCYNRFFSSSSSEANESDTPPPLPPLLSSNQQQHRRKILSASLTHVHQYGWTEDAIAQGVISAGFPPAYIGMVEDSRNKPLGLVSFFMEECNNQLEEKLRIFCEQGNSDGGVRPNRADVMEFAIRTRLSMVQKYINSKRWHEGMALGAMYPSNAVTTASQLEDLMDIIATGMAKIDTDDSLPPLGQLERVAIGAVYVSTELHMLADTSDGFEETWSFLKERVGELELMATKHSSSGLMSPEMALAASAVASSMGGAVLSLFAPATKMGLNSMAGTILPNMMSLIQQQQHNVWNMGANQTGDKNGNATSPGTSSKDYDFQDLPPFENSNDFMKK